MVWLLLVGWFLSWNPGLEEWRHDTLRFAQINWSEPEYYFKASSPVDSGYCRGFYIDKGVDNWNLYNNFFGVVPSYSRDYDSVVFYAWGASGNQYYRLYVQLVNDDLWTGWNFTTHEWVHSGYTYSVLVSTTPQRFALPVKFPSFGHFRVTFVPQYDVESGADTFYLDSVYVKRVGNYKRRLEAKERSGYLLFGFDMGDSYERYLLDFRSELSDMGMRYARVIPFLPYYGVIQDIDGASSTIDTVWAKLDTAMWVLRDSLGIMPVVHFYFSTSSWDLSSVGMRYYSLGGSNKIPYYEDAALAVSAFCQHYKYLYFPIFLVTNEQQGGVNRAVEAESLVNLFFGIRDTLWEYFGHVPVLVGGDWYHVPITTLDSIGCSPDCMMEGWQSNHLYGHPVSGRDGWCPEDWQMYTYGMLWNTNGDIGSWQRARWHIVDEFHTSIDSRYDCSATAFWQWLGLPIPFVFHRPVILMEHILMNSWSGTDCNAVFDWATHDTGSLYWGYRFLAKYEGKAVYTEDINSPFYYFRVGANTWIIVNPSQVDTFVCELPRGLALVRHLDKDLYESGQNPIVEEYKALGGKFLLPPGSLYAIEYKTVIRR